MYESVRARLSVRFSVSLGTIGPTSFGSAPPEAEADDGTAAEEDELLLGLTKCS